MTRSGISEIARCRPALAESMQSLLDRAESSPPEWEILSSRKGDDVVRLNGRMVHSSVDPHREADRLVDRTLAENPEAVVVFGTGLGYQLEALRRRNRSIMIILVEPSPALLRTALDRRTAEWWCANGPDLIVATEEEDKLTSALVRGNLYRPALLALQGVVQCYQEEFNTLREVLERFTQRRRVNRNTLRRFGKLWVRNTLHNLAVAGSLPGIDHLTDIAPGMPVLLCGAGPTLDALLPLLPELRERCLIIAVDTATIALQRIGVPPHVAIVADPQYWNTRHVDQVHRSSAGGRDTVLVAEPATHPRVLRLWQGPRVLSASLFPLGTFIDRRMGRSVRLGAGGSVATSAWDLARLMGAKEIYLAGIDLAFPGGRTHCRGSFFEERMIFTANRLEPAEAGLARYLHDGQPENVAAVGGDTVLSDRRMAVYRSWFEEQIRRFPEVTTYQLSPCAAMIAGAASVDPADLVTTLPPVTVPVLDPGDLSAGKPAQRVYAELRSTIDEIDSLARKGLELCDAGPTDLSTLDAIDERLGKLTDREVAGFLAEEALERATKMTVRSSRDAVEQARQLYSALHESCSYHRELLQRYGNTGQIN